MRKISFQLSAASCERAASEISEFAKQIKPKMKEVCKQLAELGVLEANDQLAVASLFSNADAYIGPPEEISNGYKIVMSGKDVYFIEFGTGNEVDPHFDTSVPVAWGTWSAEHRQMLWRYGFWWYDGKRYEGTPAFMPMYYADKAMREYITVVAQEVFSQ